MSLAAVKSTFCLDHHDSEDSIQDFDHILGFRCEGVAHAWKWRENDKSAEAFLGSSPNFLSVLRTAEKLKGSRAPVLISGESGTGKELLAHFIHQLEGDSARPFVAVNCGAIPENLMESEFFGHEKGAFTGAVERKTGFFEQADGGDIFLDEISALKPEMQVKLLRVLQDKKIHRIGGKEIISLDFRVIAASNENLGALVESGKFRLDLFHRISVIPLSLPPLRERREDIPGLTHYFMKKYRGPCATVTLDAGAMEFLKNYSWPGNVRQLENMIHRMAVLFPSGTITEKELSEALQGNGHANGHGNGKDHSHCKTCECGSKMEEGATLQRHIEELEQQTILETLQENRWNIQQTARELKISRTTLYKKIELYQLSRN